MSIPWEILDDEAEASAEYIREITYNNMKSRGFEIDLGDWHFMDYQKPDYSDESVTIDDSMILAYHKHKTRWGYVAIRVDGKRILLQKMPDDIVANPVLQPFWRER